MVDVKSLGICSSLNVKMRSQYINQKLLLHLVYVSVVNVNRYEGEYDF